MLSFKNNSMSSFPDITKNCVLSTMFHDNGIRTINYFNLRSHTTKRGSLVKKEPSLIKYYVILSRILNSRAEYNSIKCKEAIENNNLKKSPS